MIGLLKLILEDLYPADWFGDAVAVRVNNRKAWVVPMSGGFEIRLSSVLLMTTQVPVVSTAAVTAAVEELIEVERAELARLAELELARIRANRELRE